MFTIPSGVGGTSLVDLVTTFNLEYWALQTVAMLLTALLIPGLKVRGPVAALVTVVTLSVVNTKFWDASLFLALPSSWTLHALVLVLANAILFWVIVKILPGIEIEGFFAAIIAPVVFSACSLMVPEIAKNVDWSLVLARGLEFAGVVRDIVQHPST